MCEYILTACVSRLFAVVSLWRSRCDEPDRATDSRVLRMGAACGCAGGLSIDDSEVDEFLAPYLDTWKVKVRGGRDRAIIGAKGGVGTAGTPASSRCRGSFRNRPA